MNQLEPDKFLARGMVFVGSEAIQFRLVPKGDISLQNGDIARFGGDLIVRAGLPRSSDEETGIFTERELVTNFILHEREEAGNPVRLRPTFLTQRQAKLDMMKTPEAPSYRQMTLDEFESD